MKKARKLKNIIENQCNNPWISGRDFMKRICDHKVCPSWVPHLALNR